MAVPFPTSEEVDLRPPNEAETRRSAAGVLSASSPSTGATEFQQLLITSTFEAMTGHTVDPSTLPFVDAVRNAENLRLRSTGDRMRMVHMVVLCALVMRQIPPEVAERVAAYSRELASTTGSCAPSSSSQLPTAP